MFTLEPRLHGLTNPEAPSLPPTLRSIWLVFHILFNKLAVGAFVLLYGGQS